MRRNGNALRRVLVVLLCVLLACGALGGCSQVEDVISGVAATGEFPVEVNGVTIQARPSRVVVLSPSLADVVVALGCETQLAGASEECTQSALVELEKVPAGEAEAILGLQPDLVLLDEASAGARGALEEAGVTVLSVEAATDREDFERLYSQVSSAFAGGGAGYDEGIQAAQDIFITLDNINRIVPKETITTACYLYDLEGSAVTGEMFGSTIMAYAGVTNVFDSTEGGQYEFDSLRIADPNVIFCVPGLAQEIEGDSRFDDLQAVRDGKVIELDPTLMEWQGRTVIECAYEISANAFPELLEENSVEASDPTQEIESQVSSAIEEEEQMAEQMAQYQTLEEGDSGDAVLALQDRLAALGYLTEEYDGHYGATTTECVRRFQSANGLAADGVASPSTQLALFTEGALREDGTPLPEEAPAESGSSESDSSESSAAESSAAEGGATESRTGEGSSESSSSEG